VVCPVILCGGIGTRLWPLSRETFPKPFLNLVNERSLLQETVLRLRHLDAVQPPLIVCNRKHTTILNRQLQAIDVEPVGVIAEPAPRNTAAAIAVAALEAQRLYKEHLPVLLIMPSDNLVQDGRAFSKAVEMAIAAALSKHVLIVYGIEPVRPAPDYGYIEVRDPVRSGDPAVTVASFTEKPDIETATRMLATGRYYWNSGLFTFTAEVILQELARHAPDIHRAAAQALKQSRRDADTVYLDEKTFVQTPVLSVDHAVMEKTERAMMVLLDSAWSDLGCWQNLFHAMERDRNGNAVQGQVFLDDTKDCLVHASSGKIAVLGARDLVIVESGSWIMVATRDSLSDLGKTIMNINHDIDSYNKNDK